MLIRRDSLGYRWRKAPCGCDADAMPHDAACGTAGSRAEQGVLEHRTKAGWVQFMSEHRQAHPITELLDQAGAGDALARDRVVSLVHAELSQIARAQLRRERAGHTLQTVDLVNETYLTLFAQQELSWPDRQKFFAYAATAMRHYLVSYARRKQAAKRGGSAIRITLSELADETSADELIALDLALRRLERVDGRKARIVELRYFGGLEIEEVCELVGLSAATVHKELRAARGWLYNAMEGA
jgi:RNA polymerase sigma factor (TIGR02999 family)